MKQIDMRDVVIGVVVIVFWHALDNLARKVIETYLSTVNPWITYTALSISCVLIFNYLDYKYV